MSYPHATIPACNKANLEAEQYYPIDKMATSSSRHVRSDITVDSHAIKKTVGELSFIRQVLLILNAAVKRTA